MGIASVAELARRLTPQDVVDWMAFYDIDGLISSEMSKGKSGKVALEYAKAIEEMRD